MIWAELITLLATNRNMRREREELVLAALFTIPLGILLREEKAFENQR